MLGLAGACAGLVAGAVPGFHVNALAAVSLAAVPVGGEAGVAFLVAAFAASPFGLALSSPFLGGTTEDAALQGLPATQLAREGRAVEAVALQAWGAFFGIMAALPLAFVARAALVAAAPSLSRWMPWLLLAIVAALVLSERASREAARWARRLRALFVLGLAGALGLAAFRLGASSPLGLPASPLLPLLAGLFAAPALVTMLAERRRFPRARMRAARPLRGELSRAAWPGALVSSLIGVAPGVSASHASLLLPRAASPEQGLARLAAVNGGAVVFTLLAWHALGKARSGVLVAADAWAPRVSWRLGAAPPPEVLSEAALVVLAAGVAALLARAISTPLCASVSRASPRRVARVGLAVLVACVAAFTGALGLVELGVACAIGWLPMRWGLRRSHLMGVVLVPALLRAWGLA